MFLDAKICARPDCAYAMSGALYFRSGVSLKSGSFFNAESAAAVISATSSSLSSPSPFDCKFASPFWGAVFAKRENSLDIKPMVKMCKDYSGMFVSFLGIVVSRLVMVALSAIDKIPLVSAGSITSVIIPFSAAW